MRKVISLLALTLFVNLLIAQNPHPATSAKDRIDSYQKRQAILDKSMVANIPFESVGPTVFSGRVVDIDVSPNDPTLIFEMDKDMALRAPVLNYTPMKLP